jgi:hypothetical protein
MRQAADVVDVLGLDAVRAARSEFESCLPAADETGYELSYEARLDQEVQP